jgi:hypothetical protein
MQIQSSFARWSSAFAVLFALGVLLTLWADEDAREIDVADTHAVPSDSAGVEGTLSARNAALVERIEAAAARERSGGTLSEPSDRRDVGEEAMDAETGSPEERGVETLVEALENPDAHVFAEAVDALSELDPERLVSVLGLQLEEGPLSDDSDDSEFRSRAARGLGVVDSEDGVDLLIRAFDGTDPDLREAAASGLAQTGSDRARDFLLEAAEGSDPERKSTAISALAFDGDEVLRNVLADAYERDLIALEDIPDDALEEILSIVPEGADCLNSDWVFPSCSRALIASADEAGEGSSGSGVPNDGNCAGPDWVLPDCSHK